MGGAAFRYFRYSDGVGYILLGRLDSLRLKDGLGVSAMKFWDILCSSGAKVQKLVQFYFVVLELLERSLR